MAFFFLQFLLQLRRQLLSFECCLRSSNCSAVSAQLKVDQAARQHGNLTASKWQLRLLLRAHSTTHSITHEDAHKDNSPKASNRKWSISNRNLLLRSVLMMIQCSSIGQKWTPPPPPHVSGDTGNERASEDIIGASICELRAASCDSAPLIGSFHATHVSAATQTSPSSYGHFMELLLPLSLVEESRDA